ncbi:5'-methylthioadenosine/S-adenosylhomocysteine nucleosidase [Lottiidibacillus patelloidae]|uniref:adenosylhomocysteine nucleosidase n=1 Tax=Lottiidibacillus patelloidae TaxID=2670334 RepID=A0A263BQV5_9BACI|nr:5'-methylthioadenosine/adenosylhomocysteine nucleosidase [Lottiidibacillus patelloidae]OZM56070.1 5'-methylthioadenosine/S-adenosylhomocysteine nucleosidase [Lottiidibacillus patelloidae]
MKIAVIGAMEEEIKLMREQLDITNERQLAKITFYEGSYADHEVILCKSGVGKVNAAITTQLLIDHYNVEAIIFTGVAGALSPNLNIGDIVISTSSMYHDIDASALGFAKGTIPMFDHPSDFRADEKLIAIAADAASELNELTVSKGRILSGDQFIADGALVKQYEQQFAGACIEMEGAAVAHAAYLNDVPFVIIRSISDKANGEANVNFVEFTKLASEHSSYIVQKMLKKLKEL